MGAPARPLRVEVVTTARADQDWRASTCPWRTARDEAGAAPARPARDAGDAAVGDAYLDVEPLVRGAAIVHTAELGPWFAAQPARLRRELGFRLVITVWETIPFRVDVSYRAGRGEPSCRARRDGSFSADDGARPALPAARGGRAERIQVVEPGIDVERFAAPARLEPTRASDRLAGPPCLGEGPLRRDQGARGDSRRRPAHDRRSRAGAGPPAALCRRPRAGRPRRDPRRPLRRDAVGLRRRVVRRPRQPADPRRGKSSSGSCSPRLWPPERPSSRARPGAIPEVLAGSGAPLFSPGDWLELGAPARGRPAGRPPGARARIPPRSSTGTRPRRRPNGSHLPTTASPGG